ncbi:hypothetical protein [Methylopila turkensis]|uniref:Uncharacterized protein n=1 Tax=Methylopila turkensis TaxID=1437816 RepID=A0A9W6N6Z7_9HYPH|nr:hypothetical protein [Methylopila turkensis]GLK80023.1 hypothetical protein GCM10008174_17640 [Methylopila turkensis]
MTERSRLLLRLAVVASLAGALGGCESISNLNPFGEKETALPGERRPVPPVAPQPPATVPQPLS